MEYNQKWIDEIEDAIRSGSHEKRTDSLRKVTNLFLTSNERFNETQIGVFDHVLCRLVEKIEARALEELSEKLAPIASAPNELIQRLARHDKITIAGPVLRQSPRLASTDLVEIAKTKSQDHLLAIAVRPRIETSITDILISRGDRTVLSGLLKNKSAAISENGFESLIARADANESLAEQIGRRLDIPLKLFRELLLKATQAVREKLLAIARPEAQQEIEQALLSIADQVAVEKAAPRNFSAALEELLQQKRSGKLDQKLLVSFIQGGQYDEAVATLSMMSGMSCEWIDTLMNSDDPGGILIPCKAAGLDWPTTEQLLKFRPSWKIISQDGLKKSKTDYLKLSKSTAERIARFWIARERIQSTTN